MSFKIKAHNYISFGLTQKTYGNGINKAKLFSDKFNTK